MVQRSRSASRDGRRSRRALRTLWRDMGGRAVRARGARGGVRSALRRSGRLALDGRTLRARGDRLRTANRGLTLHGRTHWAGALSSRAGR